MADDKVLGGKGLAKRKLIIPQKTSLKFTVEHIGPSGNPVDHTRSQCAMKIEGLGEGQLYDFSEFCTGVENGVRVFIPGSATANLPLHTKLYWDLIVETTGGESIRLVYGDVQVEDTYALDETI